MRKYFTARLSVEDDYDRGEGRTIVNLLQRDDRVGRKALLRVLIEEEGFRSD